MSKKIWFFFLNYSFFLSSNSPMMIITQKITSLAFEIHDGKISLSCLKLSFIYFFYSFLAKNNWHSCAGVQIQSVSQRISEFRGHCWWEIGGSSTLWSQLLSTCCFKHHYMCVQALMLWLIFCILVSLEKRMGCNIHRYEKPGKHFLCEFLNEWKWMNSARYV